jgi:predicted Zn-dependent protease
MNRVDGGIKFVLIAFRILVLSFCFHTLVLADEDLPLLGENAAINLEQERRLGQSFYQYMLAQDLVETNPVLNNYLNELGARLLTNIDHRIRDYHFFIVKDFGVNAFAVPGGYIGVNIGLILRAQNQNQLASVMAHEIAHVRLMHSVRAMEKASKSGTTSFLSLLAGLLLSSIDPQLGSAVIFGGMAGNQQAMVNFTRENEYEADRLGINLLQGGNFDPQGMVDFFRIMDRVSGSSGALSIEYLRTHPVNVNRISEVEGRIRETAQIQPGSDYYSMFKDYMQFISLDRMGVTGTDYRKALAQIKAGNFELGNRVLEKLYKQDSDNIWYGYAFAESFEYLNRPEQAEQVYRKLLEIYPDQLSLSLRLVRLLKTQGKYEAALVIARRLETRFPYERGIYKDLADIYDQLDQPVLRIMAEAAYHLITGNLDQATRLLETVIGMKETDATTRARAEAVLEQLKPK